MRTAIFLGLLAIASSINDDMLAKHSSFYAFVFMLLVLADVVEFIGGIP